MMPAMTPGLSWELLTVSSSSLPPEPEPAGVAVSGVELVEVLEGAAEVVVTEHFV